MKTAALVSTLYDDLCLSPSATVAEIKAAWRRLISEWHPDRNPGREEEAKRRSQAINHAYTVLSDSETRRLYDESLKAAQQPHAETSGENATDESSFIMAMTALAFGLAKAGFNEDVLVGALLGRGCPLPTARTIARSAHERVSKMQRDERQAEQARQRAAKPPKPATLSRASQRISRAFVIGLGLVMFIVLVVVNQPLTHRLDGNATMQVQASVDTRPQVQAPTPTAPPADIGAFSQLEPTDFQACPEFLPANAPLVNRLSDWDAQTLCYDGFAVVYSVATKSPLFGVYKISPDTIKKAEARIAASRLEPVGLTDSDVSVYHRDKRLPVADQPDHSDIGMNPDYDLVQIAPRDDMTTERAVAQSYLLPNNFPTNVNIRYKVDTIEHSVRDYVKRTNAEVYVFTGPAYFGRQPETVANGVPMPSHFYKLAIDKDRREAWAYLEENNDNATNFEVLSYAELVQRVGIVFAPGL